jgi:predicted ArsR family transcriptional regulator
VSSADRTPDGGNRSGAPRRRSAYEVLAVTSRALLLQQVREHTEGTDTATLARLTGLHPNTVRFHLDVLLEAGLIEVSTDPARKPGRPRSLFTAARVPPPAPQDSAQPAPSRDGYSLLAAVLIDHLTRMSSDPAAAAQSAGRLWDAERAARDGTDQPASDASVVAQVTALFDELGFAPETVRDRDGWRLLLHRCPFHALAVEHPEIVCRLHLGLLQGAIDRLGRDGERVRLQAFVAPGLCEAFVPLAALRLRPVD